MARLNETVIVKNDDLLSTIETIDSIIKENENVIIIISTGVYTNLVFRSDIKFFDELYEREFNSNAMDLQCSGKRLGVRIYIDPCFSFMDSDLRIVEI